MRRLGSVVVAGLLLVVIAVTPLSAFTSGGVFESKMPATGYPWSMPVRVIVEDPTGTVLGIAAAQAWPPASRPDDRLLAVSWLGGCRDQQIWLTLAPTTGGYRVIKRETDNGCGLLMGIPRTVVMVTRLPIDPVTVSFEALGAEVG